MTKRDEARKALKAEAVIRQLERIHENRALLIRMLDEWKLDAVLLAFGKGEVILND